MYSGYVDVLQYLIDHGASTCIPGSNGGLLSCKNYDGVQHLLDKNRKEHLNMFVYFLILNSNCYYKFSCCYCCYHRIVGVVGTWSTKDKFLKLWQVCRQFLIFTLSTCLWFLLLLYHLSTTCQWALYMYSTYIQLYIVVDVDHHRSPYVGQHIEVFSLLSWWKYM